MKILLYVSTILAFAILDSSQVRAAIAITIASPNTSSGLIYQSDGTSINTTGFARVGRITGTIDFSKSAVSLSTLV